MFTYFPCYRVCTSLGCLNSRILAYSSFFLLLLLNMFVFSDVSEQESMQTRETEELVAHELL